MAQKSGKVTVAINDITLRSKPGASIDIGGVKRTSEMTDQGLHVFSEENVPSMIECTLVHLSDTDLIALRDTTNAKITFTTDTGVVYTVTGAVCAEPPKLQNGECPIKFSGPPAK